MIHELRIYHVAPGKLPAMNQRFVEHALKHWERHGIRQVGFWTTQIGASNHDLYYILEWESLAEREKRWNAFVTSPEWLAVRAETEKTGPLVNSVTNMILEPTAYSKMK